MSIVQHTILRCDFPGCPVAAKVEDAHLVWGEMTLRSFHWGKDDNPASMLHLCPDHAEFILRQLTKPEPYEQPVFGKP